MLSLEKFLAEQISNKEIQQIIIAIASGTKEIYTSVRLKDTQKNADQNASGDIQSSLDITSDTVLIEHLTKTNLISAIASEEQADIIEIPSAKAQYFVAYDPYDGGGVGDVNMTFGSIIGVWEKNPLGGPVGDHLKVACYALYGPRLTFVVSLGAAPSIFEYDEQSRQFLLLKNELNISSATTHCSPGNFRNVSKDKKYKTLVEHWISGSYKLLYAGALVTDINHILMKGHGIFTYPRDDNYPHGKLRLLYEGGPLGMLIEKAGGKATTQEGKRLLDQTVSKSHQRETFVLGSSEEVDHVTKIMSS